MTERAKASSAKGETTERDGLTMRIAVENPATGEVFGHVPDMTASEIAELARRARAAQPAWDALGFEGRGRVLRRMQGWLIDNADRLMSTICAETGKAYEDAQIAEVFHGSAAFGFWADKAPVHLADERIRSSSIFVKGKRLLSRYRPFGLVGVVGPWNYLLTNSFGDCIPALAAVNSVILKPSEITPLTSLLLAEGLSACGMPDDVFIVATGRGATGAALIDVVDMIMFTGSTATGRKVAVRAAERLIPASLELGGKDPMLVLADANVERAANHAVYWSMFNCGQTCISIERCYVEAPIYDDFVGRVTTKVRALRVATGPGTVDVGSLTLPPQVATIERHIEDARERGAKVLTGGERGKEAGYWFQLTVLVDVGHDMACMREETFSPTLPLMKVADAEEAIRLANDSEYALRAAVFTRDLARGEALARRINAGTVTVNDAVVNYTALELPMGGAKPGSGVGYRYGPRGIRKYCLQQSLSISRFNPRRDVHVYPYRARRTRLFDRLVGVLNRGVKVRDEAKGAR